MRARVFGVRCSFRLTGLWSAVARPCFLGMRGRTGIGASRFYFAGYSDRLRNFVQARSVTRPTRRAAPLFSLQSATERPPKASLLMGRRLAPLVGYPAKNYRPP